MRRLLILCLLLCLSALPVRAETLVDRIADQLRSLGYDRIETESTLLGRTRIEARSVDWDREIIVNPRTGEILRDYSERRSGSSGKSGRSSGGDLLDIKDDDDDEKDDDKKDSDDDRDDDSDSDSDSDGED